MHKNNNISCVKLLIDVGADINKADNHWFTPLQTAVKNNNISCVKLLLDVGADINKENIRGETALSLMHDKSHVNSAYKKLLSDCEAYKK